MLGYISSIIERTTREGKRFFIVNLEVLGGILEVMVWPDTLQRTAEMWQDGRLVMLNGKLRSRGDQVSFACDSVIEYDPENPLAMPAPTPAKSWNGSNNNGDTYNGSGNGNGHKNNGNGENGAAADQNINEKKVQMTTGNNIPSEPQKVVRLAVTESDDPSRDAHLLREVIGVLLEFPGRDRVNLDIRTGEKVVRMDLPVVSTGYCEDLHGRLEELLGPDTVAVHQELGLGMDLSAEVPVTMPLEPALLAEAAIDATSVSAPLEAITDEPVTPVVESEAEGPVPEATVLVAAEVAATVGADSAGDEPPF